MKGGAASKKFFTKSALAGAGLATLCGLLLWGTPLGQAWEDASYDYLFRFVSGSATKQFAVTNQVMLVLMDEDSYLRLGQQRGAWDRALHAQLLNKLADDQAGLVVFDVFFELEMNALTDHALAEAMRRQSRLVLLADVTGPCVPRLQGFNVVRPQKIFLEASSNLFGVGKASVQTLQTPRRHWPVYAPGEGDIHSLGWAAADRIGARFDHSADQQWLRYYGANGAWDTISYHLALSNAPGYFRDKIVFIGNCPKTINDPGVPEEDKYLTPYTRGNGKAVGGMEIMATTFLNLVNGDWLRRPPAWVEATLLAVTGVLLGLGLGQLKPLAGFLIAAGISLTVMLAFVSWSYYTNYWFPWLVIAGGQVPCALASALVGVWASRTATVTVVQERFPGYTTTGEPFGEGAYGKVWLVRNATGQWQALKEVQQAKFQDHSAFEREFRGIKSYKPLSNQHLGLLHIDHVNRNDQQGYFYYVMELGDPLDSEWERKGEPYQPRDLAKVCPQGEGRRLAPGECIRLAIGLLEPLEFLHKQGLVHRDIKPSNIVFVNGRPKLADVGLVRNASADATWVGTDFYMPPHPERPGTACADLYALGKVLYTISTGSEPISFPALPTRLVQQPEFFRLNEIICKACQPAAADRFATAGEMLAALREAQGELENATTKRI